MEMFFFYNNRKPRKFNYQPIFFDPEKEERSKMLESKIRQAKAELGITDEEQPAAEQRKYSTAEMREEFLSQATHLQKRKARQEAGRNPFYTNNTTLILFLVILMVVVYVLFFR